MPTQVRCPFCDRALRVPDELLGRLVKCPGCATTFTAESEKPRPPAPEREEEGPEPEAPARRRDAIRGREDFPGPGATRPERDWEEDEGPRPRPRRDRDWEEDEDYRGRLRRGGSARSQVAGPAIALMVAGGLSIGWALLNLLLHLFGVAMIGAMGPPNPQNQGEFITNMVSGVCGALVGLVLGGVILAGALQMRNLRNWGLALAGSIVAMLPCHGCCILGLPFGIWAVVVLAKPEVKNAFT
jgi:hypothetical protein